MAEYCRELFLGSYRELEQAFTEKMRALRSHSALAPIAVLVPTRLLRQHLRRALARRDCPHLNVHFLTLRNLAERLVGTALAAKGLTEAPRFAQELMLAEIMRASGEQLHYFAEMSDRRGLRRALLATFEDLADACLRPDDLAAAFGERGGKPSWLQKVRDVHRLWHALEQEKERLGLYDSPMLLRQAASLAPRSPRLRDFAHLIVYGFYDLTGLQWQLVSACIQSVDTTVYFPYRDTPAYRYADRTLAWFRESSFSEVVLPSPTAGKSRLARLQDRLFVEEPRAETEDLPPDETVSIVSAPGPVREAREVLREVLYSSSQGDDAESETVGVLLRSGEPYAGLLHELTASLGIDAYFHEGVSLSKTRAGRGLRQLVHLLGSRLRRADVIDFISTANLQTEPPEGAALQEPPVARWSYYTVKAGIVEGRDEWIARLDRLSRSLEREWSAGDDDDGKAELSPAAEKELCSLRWLRTCLVDFFDALAQVEPTSDWRTMASAVAEVFRQFVKIGSEEEDVLAVLEGLGSLDVTGIPATLETFATFLDEALEGRPKPLGRFGRCALSICDVMEARGVPFDVVIVPGLVEKYFPLPTRQDPILLDDERHELAGALPNGSFLTLKHHRREEEEMLFALAIEAADTRVTLTFPRIEDGTARPRIPSFFLLRVVEALTGQLVDFEELERQIQNRTCGRFVRMSRHVPELRPRAIDRLEYDLAAMAEAQELGAPASLLYLPKESEFFQAAAEAEAQRWGTRSFTAYDGRVTSRKLLKGLADRFGVGREPIAPTRLERYATCPFQYLMAHVFGVEILDEPERAATISPLDRGRLLHDILCEFLSQRAGRGSPGPGDWDKLRRVAERKMAEFERRGVTGYPLMWQIESKVILADLRYFLELEASEGTDFAPSRFEEAFGDLGDSPHLVLSGGREIRFRGRIDRIDVAAARNVARVIDYKTGRKASSPKDNSFHGGTALQLPIYLLAARQLLPETAVEEAQYFFLTRKGEGKRVVFDTRDREQKDKDLALIAKTIVDGIERGRFFPHPEERVCEYCDYRLPCGAGRFGRFKWDSAPPEAAAFLQMAEIE